jgi:hypothetical protein
MNKAAMAQEFYEFCCSHHKNGAVMLKDVTKFLNITSGGLVAQEPNLRKRPREKGAQSISPALLRLMAVNRKVVREDDDDASCFSVVKGLKIA